MSGNRIVTFGIYAMSISAVSLLGTIAAGYFLAHELSNGRFNISDIGRGEFLLPVIAIATAITLGICGLQLFIDSRMRHHQRAGRTQAPQHHQPYTSTDELTDDLRSKPDINLSRQILILVRNAERLSRVEQDLIQKLSSTRNVDQTTSQLLAEMHICTNRLLAQLASLTREIPVEKEPPEVVEEQAPTAS